MDLLIGYIDEELGLTVKDGWKVSKIENEPIDMMGFVFRKDRTTIRTKIFLKTRRRFIKAWKVMKSNKSIPIKLAHQCISAFGWYKNTNSWMARKKYKIDEIIILCKKVISDNSKEMINLCKSLQALGL